MEDKRHLRINQNQLNFKNNLSEQTETSSYHQLKVFQRFGFQRLFGEVFFPLILMTIVPLATLTLWFVCRNHGGSFVDFFQSIKCFRTTFYEITLGQWKGSLISVYDYIFVPL